MEPRMIHIEHANNSQNNTNLGQQHRFQYVSETNLSDMNTNRFPFGNELQNGRVTPSTTQEATHSHMMQNHYDYANNSRLFQEQQHANKKTTTKTTTTMQQPAYMVDQEKLPINSQRTDYFQPINSPNTYLKQTSVEVQDNGPYAIRVEHHESVLALNWPKLDIYLHIFLTFYFGHFAAMLFFDGVLRNIVNLYVMEQSTGSVFLYLLSIVFSIAMLAFSTWFVTICWRWWRYKNMSPESIDYNQQSLNERAKQATAHSHIFISAGILILSFFIFLALGSIDLAYKKRQVYNSDIFKQYNESLYYADQVVFIFRLLFWLVGIFATLMLSRARLYKYFCPSKNIKINKERPTTVYEVQG